MVAAKSRDGRLGLPFTGPLFWLRGAGVTPGPLSPRVSLTLAPHPPRRNPFLPGPARSRSHPENTIPVSPRGPLNADDMSRDLG